MAPLTCWHWGRTQCQQVKGKTWQGKKGDPKNRQYAQFVFAKIVSYYNGERFPRFFFPAVLPGLGTERPGRFGTGCADNVF